MLLVYKLEAVSWRATRERIWVDMAWSNLRAPEREWEEGLHRLEWGLRGGNWKWNLGSFFYFSIACYLFFWGKRTAVLGKVELNHVGFPLYTYTCEIHSFWYLSGNVCSASSSLTPHNIHLPSHEIHTSNKRMPVFFFWVYTPFPRREPLAMRRNVRILVTLVSHWFMLSTRPYSTRSCAIRLHL